MAHHATNVAPDGSAYLPPSYEECMGTQPPRYPQIVRPTGALHPPPPPPPHAYVANTSMNDYERAKRERKRRLLTIGLVGTLCTIFLFIILYIKLNLYHEAQRRHMQNNFRKENEEDNSWANPPRKYILKYSSGMDFPEVDPQEIEDIQEEFKKFLNGKDFFNPTEINTEAESEHFALTSESSTNELVNGTSD